METNFYDENGVKVSLTLKRDTRPEPLAECCSSEPTTTEICDASAMCRTMTIREVARIIGCTEDEVELFNAEGVLDFIIAIRNGRTLISPGRFAEYMGYDVLCLSEHLKKVREYGHV